MPTIWDNIRSGLSDQAECEILEKDGKILKSYYFGNGAVSALFTTVTPGRVALDEIEIMQQMKLPHGRKAAVFRRRLGAVPGGGICCTLAQGSQKLDELTLNAKHIADGIRLCDARGIIYGSREEVKLLPAELAIRGVKGAANPPAIRVLELLLPK